MICSICKKTNHDRKYCPTVFCKQIINEIFDMTIHESISSKSLMSSEIATIIFMSQHKRLGENSILRLLDPEILSIILSHGEIIQYNTTIHPIYSTPKMIHLERILKNTKNYPISNIVENNGEIYTVSSNNIIKTSNESTTLIHGKKSIIQYI